MDPIKGAGTVDYAMTVPQNQNQVQGGYEDYSTMPMVYDEAMEEKKNASSNMKGLMISSAIALAGLGFGIYKHKQVKSLKNDVTEITGKYEEAQKALDKANAEIQNIKNDQPKSFWEKFKSLFKKNKKVEEKPEVKPETKPEAKTEAEAPKED